MFVYYKKFIIYIMRLVLIKFLVLYYKRLSFVVCRLGKFYFLFLDECSCGF